MYRIFLSSPSDVKPEREAVARVVARLNATAQTDERFELLAWERDYYTADSTFQDQIARSSDCDLVICIFWKRLGSPLPDKYRRADGSLPTGTEFEFEEALEKATKSQPRTPDVLVYRKMEEVYFSADHLQTEQEQRERFLQFWGRWFQNEAGHFAAAFHHFDNTDAFEALIADHLRKWLENQRQPGPWDGGSPFRGLAAFDVEDAHVFFGRTREIERARARLIANAQKGCRFLLIQGPSGAGKSSLARAGLLARLKAEDGRRGIVPLTRHVSLTPNGLSAADSWAEGLAQALFEPDVLSKELAQGDFRSPADLAALIQSGGPPARLAIERALERAGGQGLCLLMDQLEEVLHWPEAAREALGSFLMTLTASPSIFVLATMRSEFNAALLRSAAFRALCRVDVIKGPQQPDVIFECASPGAADLREIMQAPAALAGLRYAPATDKTPALLERIEAEAPAGALPALQFLLSALYDNRDGDMLTHAAYDALGGLSGVLAARGNAVMASLPAQTAAAFPALVRALVDMRSADAPPVAREVATDTLPQDLITALSDAGLLRIRGGRARFAHEVLLHKWDHLRSVLDRERHYFSIRNALNQAFERYQNAGAEADSALLTGLALAEAEDLRATWGDEALEAEHPGICAFIAASRNALRRRSRQVQSIAALVVVLGVLGLGTLLWQNAQRQKEILNAQLQTNIAEISRLSLLSKDWNRAADALQRLDDPAATPETRSLSFSIARERASAEQVRAEPGDYVAARFAPDGTLATLTATGDLTLDGQVTQLPPLKDAYRRYFTFDLLADGDVIVATNRGEVLHLSRQTGTVTTLSEKDTVIYRQNAFAVADTADGFAFATPPLAKGSGGVLHLCQKTPLTCAATELPSRADLLAFSDDGQQLAFSSAEHVFEIDLSQPQEVRDHYDVPHRILALNWSGNGLLTRLSDGSLWRGVQKIFEPNGPLSPMLSPRTGTQDLAFVCTANIICVTRLTEDGMLPPYALYGHANDPVDIVWNPAGTRIAAVLADGGLHVWDLNRRTPTDRDFFFPSGLTGRIAVHQGSHKVGFAALGNVPSAVFDLSTRSITPLPWRPQSTDIAFSDNGELAQASGGDVITFDANAKEIGTAELRSSAHRLRWQGSVVFASSYNALMRWHLGENPVTITPDLPERAAIGGVVPWNKGVIFSVSNGAVMFWDGVQSAPLIPLDQTADTLSAMVLDIDSSGRFLVSTRADREVRVYDLTGGNAPLVLNVPSIGTRFVGFSPDGAMIAALDSKDQLSVWHFDAQTGTAQTYARFDPVPGAMETLTQASQISGIAWSGKRSLRVSAASGMLLNVDLDWNSITERTTR